MRTLIAAELVFGVSSGSGGLGWFIFENKNLSDIPKVFAGLLTVIIIGLIVENIIFRTIEEDDPSVGASELTLPCPEQSRRLNSRRQCDPLGNTATPICL